MQPEEFKRHLEDFIAHPGLAGIRFSPSGEASGFGSEFLVRTCSQQLNSVCSLHLPESFRVDLAVQLAAVA